MADRIFVAGASGAVGKAALRLGAGLPLLPHYRARSADKADPGAAVFDLDDGVRLREALAECRAVLQLIGTIRKRFASGDTYATSDVGTTRQLVEAARDAGVEHVVLLSSVLAGTGLGPYLKAKADAEALVRESGLGFTLVRPSSFVGDRHRAPPGAGLLTALPGMARFKPIAVDDLALTLLHTASACAPRGEVLEGETLWRRVAEARAAGLP